MELQRHPALLRLQVARNRHAACCHRMGSWHWDTPLPRRSVATPGVAGPSGSDSQAARAGELLSEVIYARIASRVIPSSQISTSEVRKMSSVVVVKEKDTLTLASDSRFMSGDFSSIVSDATQKIFEIAPETFIACSGRTMTCDFQHERARELAKELGTTDIEAIGEALKRESLS